MLGVRGRNAASKLVLVDSPVGTFAQAPAFASVSDSDASFVVLEPNRRRHMGVVYDTCIAD